MRKEKDYYKILGISRTATNSQIKKAYRNLSLKYHPDRHPDNPLSGLAEEKFKDISEAYEVLINQYQRRQYDSMQGYASTSNASPRYDYSKQSAKSSQSDSGKGSGAAKKAKNQQIISTPVGILLIIMGSLAALLTIAVLMSNHTKERAKPSNQEVTSKTSTVFEIANVITKKASVDLGKKEERKTERVQRAILLIILGVIGLGIPIAAGIDRRCPKCHKWWARRKEYTEEIDRSEGYGRVNREKVCRDRNGNVINRETWQENAPMVNVTYAAHYKCKNCYYKWAVISKTQYEK